MKLSELYAAEFKSGGDKKCLKCSRQSHGKFCSFCIDKELRGLGVKSSTMRIASAVFRKQSSNEKINTAIAAIDKELKK